MQEDLPQISSSVYQASTGDIATLTGYGESTIGGVVQNWGGGGSTLVKSRQASDVETYLASISERIETTPDIMAQPNQRRIVRVYIADTNENVPLDHAILYHSAEKLTDLTDQELYFECPVASALSEHNLKRVKWLDKEASKRAGKDIYLDPVRVRDLRMVVVNIAAF